MNISLLKQGMLLPEREQIIGKSVILQGKPAFLASVTEQDGVIKLWVFQQIPEPADEPVLDEPLKRMTNHEEILRRVLQVRVGFASISEFAVQGISLPVSGASYGILGHDPMSYMKIQHFIEAGVDFSSIADISFDELVLGEYRLKEGTAFPETGAEDIHISMSIREEVREELVEPPQRFSLKIDGLPEGGEYSFRDPVEDKEIVFYIDRLIRHDVRKEMEENLKSEAAVKLWRDNGLDDAAIERARGDMAEAIDRICPLGQEMLLIQYESPENFQLGFYMSEFLDSVPEYTGSASVMLFSSDDNDSVHGYKVRTGMLKIVPAGFNGTVDVELISWYRKIPGERVEA